MAWLGGAAVAVVLLVGAAIAGAIGFLYWYWNQ